jgi:hypothetical protein
MQSFPKSVSKVLWAMLMNSAEKIEYTKTKPPEFPVVFALLLLKGIVCCGKIKGNLVEKLV